MVVTSATHFTEELCVQSQLEELKLATALAREVEEARLSKKVICANRAEAKVSQLEEQKVETKAGASKLEWTQNELTHIIANLDTTTGSLSATTGKIAQLQEEVVELPKARADLVAAQKRIVEESIPRGERRRRARPA